MVWENEFQLKQKEFEQKSKICKSCLIEKNVNLFYKQKWWVLWLKGSCKECCFKKWWDRKEYCLNWRNLNKELKSRLDKDWRERNKEHIKKYRSTKSYKSMKKIRDKRYIQNIKKNNPSKYLWVKLRSWISGILKWKQSKTFDILWYTKEELKIHLESWFTKWMSRDNYWKNWRHIDHIKPLVLFDLSNEKWIKDAFSLNNLRPLWASENLSKGSLYEWIRHKSNFKLNL